MGQITYCEKGEGCGRYQQITLSDGEGEIKINNSKVYAVINAHHVNDILRCLLCVHFKGFDYFKEKGG